MIAILTVSAMLAVPWVEQLTARWFARDAEAGSSFVTHTLAAAIADRRGENLQALLENATQDERLVALGLCSADGDWLARTASFPRSMSCAASTAGRVELNAGAVQVDVHPVRAGDARSDRLVLLHDLSFMDARRAATQRYLLIFIALLGSAIALITVGMAQLSWRRWLSGSREILRYTAPQQAPLPELLPELQPFAAEVRARLRDLEDEFRRSQPQSAEWTAEGLRTLLRTQLHGDQVIVVSNREPYSHEAGAEGARVKRPASGLVTAVEPVMRACSGTWIAHGSGSGDRQVVDGHDRVAVPPESGDYLLRRIWLTPLEERGYYDGFANEGMWPLCHVAHVRPVFREADWQQYRAVNQRFADAVVAEARSDDPVVMVQDYHFALVPAMVRARLPRATILSFWHIPWPNPESFGICPWRREILHGLLGSTILGFQTRFHCKNFLETVDRYLEARTEHESSTVSYGGRSTGVESYPISIEWPSAATQAGWSSTRDAKAAVFERLGIAEGNCLAVGVDRFDYTKGLLERLQAVERLLEKRPQWVGKFVFVQVAAPTRDALAEYQAFQAQIRRAVRQLNERFGSAHYQPVQLLEQQHDRAAVDELLRAADICVVTSLHDGMNLVCKEFVAARDDEQGVLILSQFAGAARELTEALIVNPYHVEETADALHRAATMGPDEQRERMTSLRMTVREHNVFRWAGRMLADAGRSRLRERIDARLQRPAEVRG